MLTTRRIEANGLTFTIDEMGTGDDVALLLHGFPESRLTWRRQMPALARMGWRVVAPDMRGYAGSSRPKGRRAYHIDNLTADVAALFDALGARRRILVGHDWGGIVAWCAAALDVTPLDGLVILNAPHPAVYAKLLKRSAAQRKASWYVLFFQLPWLPEMALKARKARAVMQAFVNNVEDPKSFPPDVLETFRANILKPGVAKTMINYYRANTGIIRDVRLTQRIETPTLMIWGEKDFALNVELAEGNNLYVSHLTMERIPEASHWVQFDAPDRVNAAMTDWMRSRGLISSGGI